MLAQLPQQQHGIPHCSIKDINASRGPDEFIHWPQFALMKKGQRVVHEACVYNSKKPVYRHVKPSLVEHGEYSVRGFNPRLIPNGHEAPPRIESTFLTTKSTPFAS